jgi:hypothetical protein
VELVEAAEQSVTALGFVDEAVEPLVERATQPLPRLRLLRDRCQLVRTLVAELSRVGLTARHAAVEEDIVGRGAEEPLGLHRDRDRVAVMEILRRPLHGVEAVFVDTVLFAREIVPHEALHRVVVRRDERLLIRLRNHRLEDLEAVDPVGLVRGWIDAIDREPEQTLRVGGRAVDREGRDVRARDRVDGVPVDRCGLETHGSALPGSLRPSPLSRREASTCSGSVMSEPPTAVKWHFRSDGSTTHPPAPSMREPA